VRWRSKKKPRSQEHSTKATSAKKMESDNEENLKEGTNVGQQVRNKITARNGRLTHREGQQTAELEDRLDREAHCARDSADFAPQRFGARFVSLRGLRGGRRNRLAGMRRRLGRAGSAVSRFVFRSGSEIFLSQSSRTKRQEESSALQQALCVGVHIIALSLKKANGQGEAVSVLETATQRAKTETDLSCGDDTANLDGFGPGPGDDLTRGLFNGGLSILHCDFH
jgi:hypothetical protein